jgi:hypothetical protein
MANDGDPKDDTLFAGFSAANLGGMGTKWTTGCPRPSQRRAGTLHQSDVMSEALGHAAILLKVNRGPPSWRSLLQRAYATGWGAFSTLTNSMIVGVQPMPLASTAIPGGFLRHGTDVILGSLIDEPKDLFTIATKDGVPPGIHEGGHV